MNKVETSTPLELTMEAGEANMKALLLVVPLVTIILAPYIALYSDSFSLMAVKLWLDTWAGWKGFAKALAIIVVGIVTHEFIHGLSFSVFATKGFRSVKFGILLKSLTPYCHCSEPLTARQYRISTIMPAILLGIIPATIAIVNANFALLVFGIFFTLAAAGDFIILYLIRNEDANMLVLDHPEKVGCYVFAKDKSGDGG